VCGAIFNISDGFISQISNILKRINPYWSSDRVNVQNIQLNPLETNAA
jgi:hypothetical protein